MSKPDNILDKPAKTEVRLFAQWADFASRYKSYFSTFGIIWACITAAIYARWIVLPDIPFITDELAVYFAGAYNVIWWGFLYPRIEKMQKDYDKSVKESADE
ncbi:MAG: hypothetical protein AAFX04_05725 [Pseudomonadota bacterium]